MVDADTSGSVGDFGPRFDRAIRRIDAGNAEDPVTIEFRGGLRRKEPLHAELMSEWVIRLDPDADEFALIAARAHHFRRWDSPRSDYPEGRAGYLRWRVAAQRRHAAEVAEILTEEGYGPEEVERVTSIIRKERRSSDPVVQVHEDARCLVFLQTQLDGVAAQLGEDQTVDVIAKTIPKMSPSGLGAIASIDLGEQGSVLVERAVEVARLRRTSA